MDNINNTGQSNLPIPQDTTVLTKDMLNDIRDDRNIKNLIIPDSITKIEKQAFDWCRYLEYIILPNSIETIGEFAFYGCENLKTIQPITNSLTLLGIAKMLLATTVKVYKEEHNTSPSEESKPLTLQPPL